MNMGCSIKNFAAAVLVLLVSAASAFAQIDRKEVRSGNRDFRKGEWREAEIDYRKALVKDSVSFAANYNLAATMYRLGEFGQAKEALEKIAPAAAASPGAADYYYNLGDVAIALKDWQGAVNAFAQSLLINPGDLDAKENLIYARKMLQNQQNQQNDQNSQNDNKDGGNDQDNQDNQDGKNNQNDQNDKNGQDNRNNQNDGNNQNNGDDNRDKDRDSNDGEQPQLTPQAAQQMLQAIQAKEKETQDKVQKAKAVAAKSRQKEKNW